ncbi:hypothetical protein niasHT_025644 [Heterodera trifolii]|uniref:BTB domain-containing protein n=1 Tax=Heterodera trifolii TaxID=157864 RepID=A0ABD2KI51_9BILA
MEKVLKNGEHPDVQFLFGKDDKKEIVKAHRAILSSASDVFEAMFRFDEQNSKNSIGKDYATKKCQIEITDIEIGAFKTMLTFIYTMRFDGLDANNLFDVFKAADKYNIKGLVKECADFPIEKLPNVFESFQEALFRDMKYFAGRCLRYINQNISALIESEAFLQIDQDFLCVILERDQLRISELEIWNAALRWADEQCRRNGTECSAENRRKILGPALSNIRFPLMPKEDFTKSELLDPSKGFYNKDEDKVTLAIDVIINDSKTEKFISDPNKSNGTISMEIEEVSEFAREIFGSDRKSEETVYIKGMPWKIWAEIEMENENESTEKWLGFYLSCDASEKAQLNTLM